MMIAAEIAAMIAAIYQPALAQSTGSMPALPWGAQLGVIGLMGGLLWWQMAKVQPAESKRHSEDIDRMLQVQKDCSDDISCDIKEMTSEIKHMRSDSQKIYNTMQQRPCLHDRPSQ